jgi:hypothetical protein
MGGQAWRDVALWLANNNSWPVKTYRLSGLQHLNFAYDFSAEGPSNADKWHWTDLQKVPGSFS